MNAIETTHLDARHIKVDPAGRVVIPADLRVRHNIHPGDTLVIRSHDHGLALRTYDQSMREAQDYVCSLLPSNRSLANELIEERRRESAAE